LTYSNGHDFWLGCMCEAHDITRRSKMNNGSSREIQMVITFHKDVQFRLTIYRDSRNCTWKLSENSNSHNFWLGCMCDAHDTLRRSKMNRESSREIQMIITFHSAVCVRPMIYWDARKWTMEALEKFKWLKLFTRMSDSGSLYIEPPKIERVRSRQVQTAITFDSSICMRPMIYRNARKWTTEAFKKF